MDNDKQPDPARRSLLKAAPLGLLTVAAAARARAPEAPAAPAAPAGTIETLAVASRALGRTMNVALYLPPGGARHPILYLFHGFVIKTFKAIGWPEFTASYPTLGLVLTVLGAIGLTFFLACPPVRRVLEPFTNPLGWLESRHRNRADKAPTSA